ncbi:MAG: carbohydrate ABC transporter permease [Oscillospiraceae bacterium]|jgi:putative aldouronate transport system permease protein|nr:carbohydrate ABC transporter permease [Oscillospiraceae bacterium]
MAGIQESRRKPSGIRNTSRLADAGIIAAMSLAGLLCLLPIVNVLALSFSSSAAAAAGRVKLWPVDFSLESYKYALTKPQFLRSFAISVKRVGLGLAVNMACTVLAAYPLSKSSRELTGRGVYAWFFFFTMIFSGGLIPWYTVVKQTGIMNTLWGVILPGAVPAYHVIILLNFFRQLPRELGEAAVMDGAGEFYMMVRLYLPLSVPSLATLALFTAVGHWNSWFDGLVLMTSPDNYPLQTYLRNLIVVKNLQTMQTATQAELREMARISDRTLRASQIFIAALPVLALYPYLQKYFMKGLVMGSVKG